MKLAEALLERSELNRKIEELRYRITNNVLVQEGKTPSENPEELMKELDGAVERLAYLMAAINLTNCQTMVQGRTVTELIAEKDALSLKVSAYRDVVNEASSSTRRARGTEIRIHSVVDVSELRRQTDAIAKQIRELDTLLQATNWQTDLIEE